jgi:hypothetical protein
MKPVSVSKSPVTAFNFTFANPAMLPESRNDLMKEGMRFPA